MSNAKREVLKTEVITLSAKDKLLQIKAPPCLVLLSGDDLNVGRQWNLDRPSVSLGRTAESDIHLAEGGLSKVHASFTYVNGHVSVTDLGSTNKTLVNKKELPPNQPCLLKNNDMVQTGRLFFKFLQRGVASETVEKERMQTELESARNIQSTLLPVKSEATYNMVRIAGRYRSASECGGDWWWHWSSGSKAFAIIGDVTGHGVGAAMITSAARSAVSTLEDDANGGIEKVYTTLGRALHKTSIGKIVMSAFIVEYDFKTSKLRFINASHLPAVLIAPEKPGSNVSTLGLLDCKASQPLGAGTETFTIGEGNVRSKCRLVLLTDGLTERKNAAGAMIREKVFYDMLMSVHASSANNLADFLDRLMAQSDAMVANTVNDDDITVVAIDFF